MRILPINKVDPEVLSKLSAVKVSLMTKPKYTFFTSALLRLNISYMDSGTLATDGINLYINPDFVQPLTNRQIAFAFMHEICHVIYEHLPRRGKRDPKIWNIATDYVINNQLDDMGMDVIDGICLDHQYDGMSADQVYAKLFNDPNTQNQSPQFDDIQTDVPDGTPDSNGNPIPKLNEQQLGEAVKDLVNSSVIAAQMGGQEASSGIPSEIQRLYQDQMQPLIDWRDALRECLFSAGKQGSSYKKPSRRGRALGLTLPGKLGKGLGRIDFSIDTSGSVSEDMFNQFVSEIAHVMESLKPKAIGISQFDHELKCRDVIESASDFSKVQFTGGGGTEIVPVLEMFKEVDSKALVVLTDGYFYSNRDMNPGKPVIWCIYGNPTWVPPFGTAIHFNLEGY